MNELLIAAIGLDFSFVEQQLEVALPELLAARGVSAAVRVEAEVILGGVVKELAAIHCAVNQLCHLSGGRVEDEGANEPTGKERC